MKWLSVFIVGLLSGAVLVTLVVGGRLDTSYLERKALQNKVVELQGTIQRLEESLADQQQQEIRIEQVKVSLLDPPDAFVALDLEEATLRLLTDLIGKDVGAIDLRLVHNLIEDRIVEVQGKRYCLRVRGIQLYRQVEVLVLPEAVPEEPEP